MTANIFLAEIILLFLGVITIMYFADRVAGRVRHLKVEFTKIERPQLGTVDLMAEIKYKGKKYFAFFGYQSTNQVVIFVTKDNYDLIWTSYYGYATDNVYDMEHAIHEIFSDGVFRKTIGV